MNLSSVIHISNVNLVNKGLFQRTVGYNRRIRRVAVYKCLWVLYPVRSIVILGV